MRIPDIYIFRVLTITLLITINTIKPEDCSAQDAEFSQFYTAPLYMNPALTGISYGPRFSINYRNQWPALDKGFVTYGLAYDQHIDKLSGGIGLMLFSDVIAGGLMSTYSIYGSYAYQLSINKKMAIKIGVQGGYIFRSLNFARLTFADQLDPVYGFVDEFGNTNLTQEQIPDNDRYSSYDVNAGIILFSNNFYGGVAVKHLTQPTESFLSGTDIKVPMRIAIHGGGEIPLTKHKKPEISLSPSLLVLSQGTFNQINFGTYLHIGIIYSGFWYRHTINNPDAVIGVVGFQRGRIRIGYSYDVTLSALGVQTGGAHEVSFSFNLTNEKTSLNPINKRGQLECPRLLSF